MVDSTKAMLEAQLEAEVEADGDAGVISELIARIDSMPEDGVELTAEALAIEPIVVPPTETQPLPIEKENHVTSISITKEALGIGGEFESSLEALSLADIQAAIVEVEDTEDLEALVASTSKIAPETRLHVEQRGEIRRMARGFALFAAGGVGTDGHITSPDGNVHYVEDGVCRQKTLTKQPDSFTGTMATIERVTPCLGHLEYRNTGTSDKPKFVKTGKEYTRCLHQWALMFAAGYFTTFSKGTYHDVVVTEIAQRVGDEQAREVAQEQISEWRASSTQRFEERKFVAQAIAHTKDVMGLDDADRLPAAPAVLELTLPNGKTVKDSVLALGGARFVASFELPINGETSRQNVRAGSLAELASRVAPIYAAAKRQELELVPVEVKIA